LSTITADNKHINSALVAAVEGSEMLEFHG